MSMRSVYQALVVVLGLSFSGLAFARQPPSLVKQQEAASHASRASAGYRDITWRFGIVPAQGQRVVRAAGGYSDKNYRFGRGSWLPNHAASAATPSRWR
jgi:hypothetical protein